MFTFSFHAKQQAQLRFPKVNIYRELKDLVELGGQRGNSKAYLTKSDMVLIVEDNSIIVTVQTKQMYFGNVAMKADIDLSAISVVPVKRNMVSNNVKEIKKNNVTPTKQRSEVKRTVLPEADRLAQAAAKAKREEWGKQLVPIVKEHLEQFALGYESFKERHADLKGKGFSNRAIKLYDDMYMMEFYGNVKI